LLQESNAMPVSRRAVVVICDGMRRDLVSPERTPNLWALKEGACWFASHRSVFPSVTRASSASIATGCHPARHGLHGNTMALPEAAGYAVHNVGDPAFVDRLRAAMGLTLRVPTAAERLRAHGGAIVFSNVSAGAAYFQDPDGHGHVYHRAGSYGPGRAMLPTSEHLDVSHDAAGDALMTERFCAEVLRDRRPALALLWLCEPDHTQHECELGSHEHLAVMAAADRCVGAVAATVERLRAAGDDLLFMVGSDHGHETIRATIPVERLLYEAGFKRALDSNDIVLAPQGSSALLYFSAQAVERVRPVATYLRAQPWIGQVLVENELERAGMRVEHGLRIAFSMAKDQGPNVHGIAGLSDIATRFEPTPKKIGMGQHGGFGAYEQAPFLLASGTGFVAAEQTVPTSIIDLAPTIMRHLGHTSSGMDGRALQRVD
jgi:arylsulfatase A-like enzyme